MLRLRWIILAAVLSLFAAIMGTSYYTEMRKITRLTALVDERMAVLVSMSRTVQELQEKIAFFGTSEGLAHLAREKYNLSFPGEMIFKIERKQESLP
ncbi:MAG: septum formation initiator [Aminobacteriaceae bacterium]